MKKTKKPINELKGIKKEDMIPVKQKKSKRKRGLYLGYYSRLIFNVILFLSLVVTSYIFINKSIVIQEAKNVSYEEHGNTDYKVFLKDNIYYEDKYLDKNMSYIANLIDYISVDYNYNFKADTLFDGEYSYKIRADLEILNAENKTLFFTKRYDLIKHYTETILANIGLIQNYNERINSIEFSEHKKYYLCAASPTPFSGKRFTKIRRKHWIGRADIFF